jgi:hypothetical protein
MGSNQALGARNKNPLNIRYSSANNWTGQTGQNKGFCVFSDLKWGYRAAFKNLRSYHSRGLNTIRSIISSWAPQTENNTTDYIAYVVKQTGYNADAVLSFDFDTYKPIVRAMSKIESLV